MGPVGVPFEQGQDLRAGFRVDMSTPVFIVGSQANRVAALVAEGGFAVEQSLPRPLPHTLPGVAGEVVGKVLGEGSGATMVMNNLPSGVE